MNIISLCKLLTTKEMHQEKVGPNSFKLQPFLIWSQKNKGIHLKFREIVRYQRDGALVLAFVSHHYGPVSNSRGDDIRKFSLVLVLTLAPKGFSPDTPVFPSKTIISKSLILSGSGKVSEFEPLCECATPKSLYTHYKLICKPHGS